ncbi:hypothetical protein L291_4567 [Acinetobacter guillouiae MSP4-18]|nr:hypothetical protein L291_4567 [Acinetobacter guillouiae MSP4-18]
MLGYGKLNALTAKKVFELQAEASIDYWVHVKEEKEEG